MLSELYTKSQELIKLGLGINGCKSNLCSLTKGRNNIKDAIEGIQFCDENSNPLFAIFSINDEFRAYSITNNEYYFIEQDLIQQAITEIEKIIARVEAESKAERIFKATSIGLCDEKKIMQNQDRTFAIKIKFRSDETQKLIKEQQAIHEKILRQAKDSLRLDTLDESGCVVGGVFVSGDIIFTATLGDCRTFVEIENDEGLNLVFLSEIPTKFPFERIKVGEVFKDNQWQDDLNFDHSHVFVSVPS